jgi:nicotinate-nucleotide adenylyltransferase
MKIGIMGGTFDPIHIGHLRAAENAREALGLDVVRFIPASVPPHRPGPLTPATDRYAMVSLATASNSAFVPSDVEIRREGPSYTADTMEALAAESPGDDLYLIVGSDTFPEVRTWREPERIFSACRVAVVHRPGEVRPVDGHDLPIDRVCWVEGAGLPISATEVRRRVREGHSIRYLVAEGVADYIRKRGLYRG